MTKFYTYLYSDPSRNNEPIYVGKGQAKRAWDHLKRKDHCEFVHRLQKMLREGVQPLITFFCKDVDNELACLVEMEAVAKFGRKNLGLGTLLNLTDGGDEGTPGVVVSEETRQKLSVLSKGRKVSDDTKALMSKVRAGEKRPEGTGAKISLATSGKKRSEESKANMRATRSDKMYTAERNEKIRTTLMGRKLSAETKAKISAARLNYLANKSTAGVTL